MLQRSTFPICGRNFSKSPTVTCRPAYELIMKSLPGVLFSQTHTEHTIPTHSIIYLHLE